jgi:predicted transposase YdaD
MDIRELQAEAKREGRQEGRAEGLAEGIRDTSVTMLKNMMEAGFSNEDACRILKLDEEEFRSLVQ